MANDHPVRSLTGACLVSVANGSPAAVSWRPPLVILSLIGAILVDQLDSASVSRAAMSSQAPPVLADGHRDPGDHPDDLVSLRRQLPVCPSE